MKNNGLWKRVLYCFGGCGTEEVECKEHSYAWSGKMPCTGIKKCIYCGKPFEGELN